MKKYLITGIIVLLPVALTIYVIVWIINLLTSPFADLVENLIVSESSKSSVLGQHDLVVEIISRIIVLAFLFCLTLILGFYTQKISRHYAFRFGSRIPFISSIYRISKEVTKSIFTQGGGSAFKGTVLVPFPRPETHALGLITGEVLPLLKEKIADLDVAVFVPTSPHPFSGYIIMAPKSQIIPVDISTEDVFKILISCGSTYTDPLYEHPANQKAPPK